MARSGVFPMNWQQLALGLATLLLSSLGSAGETASDIAPGHYVPAGDWGTLSITTDASARTRFDIESMGGNCHLCAVSGVIHGTTGIADAWLEDDNTARCRIAFRQRGGQIAVEPITEEECRNYCGARAGFAGIYKTLPARCTHQAQQAGRKAFLELYRARQFAAASEKLAQLLAACGEFMNWVEIDAVRNDLALAQFHDGKPAACLKTLAATRAAKAADADDLGLPPCDHDNYIEVAKATWHNLTLCKKANTRHR